MIAALSLHNIYITNCYFEKNIVKGAITNIHSTNSENINETICLLNNNVNVTLNQNQLLGGCFKSSNVHFRVYAYVIIYMGYSEFTTIGITLNDDFYSNFIVSSFFFLS